MQSSAELMFYARKALPILVFPLGFALIAMVIGVAYRRNRIAWIGIAVLWLSSLPFVSTRLIRWVESGAERASTADVPAANAVVVLSGGRSIAPGRAGVSEWGDPDRFFAGVELLHAGKGRVIVFTGGHVPWEDSRLEGDILREWAMRMGVAGDRILTTRAVLTTEDEAVAVRSLLDERRQSHDVLLVTSAFHMRRARQLFERAGLRVAPFPVDFRSSGREPATILSFLPSSQALAQTEMAVREIYGRLYYRLF